MEDKSSLSLSLQNLDEGNLVFLRTELFPLLSGHVDVKIREFTCDSNLKKVSYTKCLEMCQSSVLNNLTELDENFRWLIASLSSAEVASNLTVKSCRPPRPVSSLCLTVKSCMDFSKMDGEVVDADEMLRPKLKSYILSTKRKQLYIVIFQLF